MTLPTHEVMKVEGLRELSRNLRLVHDKLPRELGVMHKKVVEPIAALARRRAPEKTGTLKGDIRTLGSQRYAQVAVGRASIPYAGPIHWGWRRRNIEPQPFLLDAINDRREETVDLYYREIDDLIRRVWT